MQDWEWEVADASRIDEFLDAYDSGELDDDERFALMEILIQSFENLGEALHRDARWPHLLDRLDRRIALHAYSVWYWSDLENDNIDECWHVTPSLRVLLERHRTVFARCED